MNPRTRIKICGITRISDAEAVADAGADALGLVFAAVSSRRIAPPAAAVIARAMEGRLLRVGLFVDQGADAVKAILDQVPLDLLQFQGEESGAFCAGFGLPYMKAHRVAGVLDTAHMATEYPGACCHHLDAYVAGQPGGTGQSFDWGLWPRDSSLRFVLAGGLNPENVAQAIAVTRPFAVDVSGGVEGDRKGIKDPEKIRRFVAAVRRADAAGIASDSA